MFTNRESAIQKIHASLQNLNLHQLENVYSLVDRFHSENKKANSNKRNPDWPHAPIHRLPADKGIFMLTASTFGKQHFFQNKSLLCILHDSLLTLAVRYSWHLEAWAVFSNHYHFVGSCKNPKSLTKFIRHLHSQTARIVNEKDNKPGRRIWFNYWETELTFYRSYLARLNYVHQNPVHHQLVPVANQYPFCSASWFERTASPSQIQTIYGFKIDKINVRDDFSTILPD